MSWFKVYHDDLLTPEERVTYSAAYEEMSNLILETLKLTIHVHRESELMTGKTREDHHFVPILLAMDFVDAIDGVAIQVRSGSATNCEPLLRTAFEVYLNLAYLLQSEDTYPQRSRDYEFWYYRKCYDWADARDPNSARGKSIAGKLKNDDHAKLLDGQFIGLDVDKERRLAKTAMDSPRMAMSKAEYERCKPKNWFSMWGGPSSIEDLAFRLNETALYETLYRPWSTKVHGSGSLGRYENTQDGKTMMRAIRSPAGLHFHTFQAVILAFNTTTLLQSFFLKSDSKVKLLHDFYMDTITPGLGRIERYKHLNQSAKKGTMETVAFSWERVAGEDKGGKSD
jgi:hypothetical protein